MGKISWIQFLSGYAAVAVLYYGALLFWIRNRKPVVAYGHKSEALQKTMVETVVVPDMFQQVVLSRESVEEVAVEQEEKKAAVVSTLESFETFEFSLNDELINSIISPESGAGETSAGSPIKGQQDEWDVHDPLIDPVSIETVETTPKKRRQKKKSDEGTADR
jgi:hypothetical protein